MISRAFSFSINLRDYCKLLVLAATFLSPALRAQQITTEGTDFYIGYFPGVTTCQPLQPYLSQMILITSLSSNDVDISYFTNFGTERTPTHYTIAAKRSIQVMLDPAFTRPNPAGERVEYRACHIKSTLPISVQYYSEGPVNCGMFRALPTNALGKAYVVAALPSNPQTGSCSAAACPATNASSEFMVVATEDSTLVKITPNGLTQAGMIGVSTGSGAKGVPRPFFVTLNRGATYLVKSFAADAQNDLSGSQVTANKPIAVIAGNEGGFNGSFYSGRLEQRDLTIEQMIPVEYWATRGYLTGPELVYQNRLFTFDTSETTILANTAQGTATATVKAYQPPGTSSGSGSGTAAMRSMESQPFFVEQYQYGSFVLHASFTAPNQFNVVPRQNWKREYLWAVPDIALPWKNTHYLGVIAPASHLGNIQLTQNGSTVPLSSLASVTSLPIAGYPELVAKTYKISPGAYYAKSDTDFTAFQFGLGGFDNDNDFGDADCDEWYGSYAASCGQLLTREPVTTIEAVTGCEGWGVSVFHSRLTGGIIQVRINPDTSSSSFRRSDNAFMDPESIYYPFGQDSVSFNIKIRNPFKDAVAYLWVTSIVDEDTVYKLFELRYSALKFSMAPASINLIQVSAGSDSCQTITLINFEKPGGRSIKLRRVDWLSNENPDVSVTIDPPLNLDDMLAPGDTIRITACYKAPAGARLRVDSLLFETECGNFPVPISTSSISPIIYAEDVNFGTVPVGSTLCKKVRVTNKGKAAFTLTKNWILDKKPTFTFQDETHLPLTLKGGEWVELNFCYTPQASGSDTGRQQWGTTLPDDDKREKDFTRLFGKATEAALVWDHYFDTVRTECDSIQKFVFFLENPGTRVDYIDSVVIEGPDADEFVIDRARKSHGYRLFDLSADGVEEIHVRFVPNIAKGFGRRFASIVAHDLAKINPIAEMVADLTYARPAIDRDFIEFGEKKPGEKSTQSLRLRNVGTSTLHIDRLSMKDGIAFKVISPIPPFSLAPDSALDVTIEGVLAVDGDVFETLEINGLTSCAGLNKVAVHLSTVTGTRAEIQSSGTTFSPTYTCKTRKASVSVTNTGTRRIKVHRVELIDDNVSPGGAVHFTFDNNSRVIPQASDLDVGSTLSLPIIYSPRSVSTDRALVEFTLDSSLAGNSPTWVTTVPIDGSSKNESTSLTATIDGIPYSAKPDEVLMVPIQLTNDLSSEAHVRRMEFHLTYRRDLLTLRKLDGQSGLIASSTQSSLSGEDTTVRIRVESQNGSITSSGTLLIAMFETALARDTMSNITLSNLEFFDGNAERICYISSELQSTSFRATDACGDRTVREFLNTGQTPTRILAIYPNPASHEVSVEFAASQAVTVSLQDVLGNPVAELVAEPNLSRARQAARFPLTHLSDGSYILRISNKQGTSSRLLRIVR